MIKFDENGQWKLMGDAYEAVYNPEKFANRDASYKGISSQTDHTGEISDQKAIVSDDKVLSDHADREISPTFDAREGTEDTIDGIEKNPPDVDTPGILFDEDGKRR